MTSIVSICNLALSNIRKANINDLNDANEEARRCKQFYAQTLDTLLQAHPWRFAMVTAALAEVASDNPRWGYAYSRPSDCLKVHLVTDVDRTDYRLYGNEATAYAIEGPRVFASISPAFLVYTRRLEDPSQFPPLFIEALSWHLAVRLAMPLTGDAKIRAEAWQLAQQMQGAAAASDANEVRETTDYDCEWIEARG